MASFATKNYCGIQLIEYPQINCWSPANPSPVALMLVRRKPVRDIRPNFLQVNQKLIVRTRPTPFQHRTQSAEYSHPDGRGSQDKAGFYGRG
jgi:hypothetical protein